MNKKDILILLFIISLIFSCRKKYSQSELVDHNISMSKIDEFTSEIIINGISSYVIEKPGTVYENADLFLSPSDNSEPYYFYDKVQSGKNAVGPVFKDVLSNSLNDDRDLYILGMTKNYDKTPWYYVRFFNTSGTFEAWIKGDSLVVESF